MLPPTLDARLRKLEAARKPPSVRRMFVVIGADQPRHPGEITIGGVPTDERPQPGDVVLNVVYEQRSPVRNPPTSPAAELTAPAESPAPAPAIDPDSRIGRAYGLGSPWHG